MRNIHIILQLSLPSSFFTAPAGVGQSTFPCWWGVQIGAEYVPTALHFVAASVALEPGWANCYHHPSLGCSSFPGSALSPGNLLRKSDNSLVNEVNYKLSAFPFRADVTKLCLVMMSLLFHRLLVQVLHVIHMHRVPRLFFINYLWLPSGVCCWCWLLYFLNNLFCYFIKYSCHYLVTCMSYSPLNVLSLCLPLALLPYLSIPLKLLPYLSVPLNFLPFLSVPLTLLPFLSHLPFLPTAPSLYPPLFSLSSSLTLLFLQPLPFLLLLYWSSVINISFLYFFISWVLTWARSFSSKRSMQWPRRTLPSVSDCSPVVSRRATWAPGNEHIWSACPSSRATCQHVPAFWEIPLFPPTIVSWRSWRKTGRT